MTNTKLTGMHARWANILQEYDFEFIHRSGLKNPDADGLSRNSLPSDHDQTDARMDHVMNATGPVSICLALMARPEQANDEQVDPILNPFPLVAAPPRAEAELDLPVLLDRELWHDEDVLTYLRDGTYPDGASTKVKDRRHLASGTRLSL
jgi:hypothetical protein